MLQYPLLVLLYHFVASSFVTHLMSADLVLCSSRYCTTGQRRIKSSKRSMQEEMHEQEEMVEQDPSQYCKAGQKSEGFKVQWSALPRGRAASI